MSPRRRWLGYGLIGAIAGGFGAWAAWQRLAPVREDTDATALLFSLNLPDHQGNPVDFSRWRGTPLVVNFWATWCPPCIEEMPDLERLYSRFKGQGLEIIAIGIDSPDNIRQFALKYKFSYPLLTAGAGGAELARRFGNRAGGLPYTLVIDRKGVVTRRILGRFNTSALRADIEAVLR
jgi:peroxiredoxin